MKAVPLGSEGKLLNDSTVTALNCLSNVVSPFQKGLSALKFPVAG